MSLGNSLVVGLLRSPFHRVLSGSTDAIRYVGRRSGRTVVTPTQFARSADGIVIMAGHPTTKAWWRNFRQGHDLEVLLDGTWVPMRGVARVGAEDPGATAPLLDTYLTRFPRVARTLPADPEARVRSVVLVDCHPAAPGDGPRRGGDPAGRQVPGAPPEDPTAPAAGPSHEAGHRCRNQPAPPWAVYEALVRPHRDASRPWLLLLDDEVEPRVLESDGPHSVTWSSIWVKRPDALLRFDLTPGASGQGTDLCWTLTVEEPLPDAALLGHLRKRVNELVNANLRYAFGQ